MKYLYFIAGWFVAAIVLSWLFALASANDTAAERDDITEQLSALKSEFDRKRAELGQCVSDLRRGKK